MSQAADLPTERTGRPQEISAEALAAVLGTRQAPQLVDVREPDEFESWSIAGAQNVPLSSLPARLALLDRTRPAVVLCASGQRSLRAAETLRAAGVDAVSLTGGMAAWAGVYDTAWCDLGQLGIVQVRRRGKGCLSYVLGAGGEALVVDPSMDTARYEAAAASRGWRICRVLDTHLHADHVSGARVLAETAGASLHLSPCDPFGFQYVPLTGGERFTLGSAQVEVLASPGHTEGSVVLDVAGRALLTGDTLFVDGVGRPDLADRAEEYAASLYSTLHANVLDRPDDVLVLPAHYGDGVTVVPRVVVGARLGDVRAAVPELSWDRPAFVSWATARAMPRPPRYADIVRANTGELAIGADERRALELGPNRCAAA